MAASSGDTILVYPGTWYENLYLTFASKDITIAGLYLTTQDESYIYNTIIDGNQNGSCIAIRNTGQAEIMISGFTIQNGNGYGDTRRGGGIYIKDANPKIKNNIIKNCFSLTGGGLYLYDTEATLSGNIIKYNHCNTFGGGVFLAFNATIIFDTISKNSIFLNYAGWGADISKSMFCPEIDIIVDTFTIMDPDVHFALSYDNHGFPMDDISLSIENPKIIPTDNDIYVNPISGNNLNSGLSPDEALKTIAFAIKKIYPDSLDPNSIILSNGTYALSINNEMLPISARSYISILGNHKDSTIVNAEHLTKVFNSSNQMRNYLVSNIGFKNGFGNHYSITNKAGLYLNYNENVIFKNISLQNTISSVSPGFNSLHGNNTNVFNSEFFNNQGGWVVQLGNTSCSGYKNIIANCIINNNGPDDQPEDGTGGGLGIAGSFSIPDAFLAEIINVQISENFHIPEGIYLHSPVALVVKNKAKCDLINATIGNNISRRPLGVATNVDEGAILNIYNTIMFGDSLYEMSLGSEFGSNFPATANIAYSNIEGGEDEIMNWYNQHTLNWLDGNMDEDPKWNPFGQNSPYELLWDSPCINAGTPMYEPGMELPYIKIEDEQIVLYKYDGDTIHLPATDLAGNPRISGGRIDMGAYEFQDTASHVRELFQKNEDENKILVYPNPFTAHTFITFRLKNPGKVLVQITDLNGRTIKNLMDARISTGEYTMTWEGNDNYGNIVKAGTYIVTITLNGKKAAGIKIVKKRYH